MEEPPGGEAGFGSIGEYLHEEILSRLPAPSFASAACVSRSWSFICNRILTRPKLLSAISLNPFLENAVNEVLNKVLSEPIRPHFAIASIGNRFKFKDTLELIRAKLGSRIPIIISLAEGIIGKDAATNKHKEIQWLYKDDDMEEVDGMHRLQGIVLTVGFVPGLKVRAIPLMKQQTMGLSQMSAIDKLITDINDYTASVSGSMVPVGIIMFADSYADMTLVLEKMDHAMSKDTIIIGEESGFFVCNNGVHSVPFSEVDAITLVFATDRGKPQGVGEIHFSLALSTGVSPVGPIYKGASVRVTCDVELKGSTWLTARREGSTEKLDGDSILQEIENVIEGDALNGDLYIGVEKHRKYSIGSEKGRRVSFFSLHEVSGGDESYLHVKGDGIKTGDTFQFYRPDPQIALMSRNDVFESLAAMKQSNGDKKKVCGGLIFSCYGRGESFLGHPNVDSSAFLENFPGVPLSGVFCCGEIGRSSSTSQGRYQGGLSSGNCFLHVYSAVYLLILHTPAPLHPC